MLAIQNKPNKPGMPDTSNWPNLGIRPNNTGNGSDIRSLLLSLLQNGGGKSYGGGIFSTLLGIISNAISNKVNQKWAQQQQEAAWDREQKFADQAYQRQLAMIEKYQTPKAMVRMLKEAGLSVGMMYSKGGMGSVGSGSISKGSASMGSVPMLSNPLSMMGEMLQLSKLKAEMDNIKADTQNKLKSAENTEERTIEQRIKNYIANETQDDQIKQIIGQAHEYAARGYHAWTNEANNAEKVLAESTITTILAQLARAEGDGKLSEIARRYGEPEYNENGRIVGGGDIWLEYQKLKDEAQKSGIDLQKADIELGFLKTEKTMGIIGQILKIILGGK